MWDFIEEVTWIAQQFTVPVKLVWTREDDIRHGYFRQQTLHRMRGGLDAQGLPTVWVHRQVAAPTGELLTPPTMSTLLPESLSAETRQQFGEWLGRKTVDWMGAFQGREGAIDLPYGIPNTCFTQISYDPGMPVSIWRSVGNSYNAFVVESFIDEMAAAAGRDPLSYRREQLAGKPRQLAVLDKLAAVSAWGTEAPGRSTGIAIFASFGSVVGQVAEVSVGRNNRIRVHKVTCVVDCGFAVSPDIVKQQMESGIVFGLTAALYGEINMAGGKIRQSNFHDYRMLRLSDAPAIDVHIINSGLEPQGVGEPGTPVIAPAVANAVYAATGKRLRSLPLRLG
jgi:CO/xanthine dehydrogenase Mo-binding subunit